MSEASPKIPTWRSHKIVAGDRITGVSEGEGDVLFRWHLACGVTIDVDEDLARRIPRGTFSPVSGYFVQYEDGFRSWSPAEAFEAGYTRIATEA